MATYKVIGKGQDGKYFDDAARRDVINYCQQEYKTPSALMGSRAVSLGNAAFEMETIARLYNNDHKLRLRHSIISFDERDHISPAQAAQIAEAAIRYFGNEFQVLYAIHEDAGHIHAHIVMNQVSYVDGHKYHGSRAEYYAFVGYMKTVVRPYHILFIPVSGDSNP